MYYYPPVEYIEPLFRPPSEGNSLILQVTNGCSWNNCTFCEMYTEPQKRFKPKAEAKVLEEIRRCGEELAGVRRIFLADGDAMALSFRRLKTILEAIRVEMPAVTRVSAYCLPRNLKNKTVEELQELRELGLGLLYIGAESGDDEVLAKIQKGETYRSTCDALLKAKAAGMKTSVMIINGMGGVKYSEQHALAAARLVNETQPDYFATLVLFFRNGMDKVQEGFGGDFQMLDQQGLFLEMEMMLSHTELERSVFRSDHASNYLVLKGVLGRDKDKMLAQIRGALENSSLISLRNDSYRGL
ncbi:radical SAM protein [Pontibacterium sp. N1Y112]|uniref:Radical SAM protein n=1 Tax=Pontibacterium sinense TaxID=2781979 RepID=A0A8J7F728_9GAMM|nr:radical SAM protein [Pontibacterium sinense]MBE9396295.1 radical SAM protein [Pontibacterium sinense]